MAVSITPEIMETAYELLRATEPFRGWKLPPADEVEFCVARRLIDGQADYEFAYNRHRIRVVQQLHHTLQSTLMAVAHEMCHMKECLSGTRGDLCHGAAFNRLADRVCRVHLFDRGQF